MERLMLSYSLSCSSNNVSESSGVSPRCTALVVDARLTIQSTSAVLLHDRDSRYQPDSRESQCLPAPGLPRNHHTRRNSKCNLRLQVDVRYGNDKVGNGLGLQSLLAYFV